MNFFESSNMRDTLIKGSLLVHKTYLDFSKGEHAGTVTIESGEGTIQLCKTETGYLAYGSYTSQIIRTEAFRELVMSWNADTPADTSVMIEAQVCVFGKWSKWLSWGIWSSTAESSSVEDDTDPVAYIDADTLVVREKDSYATAVRYKVTLNSKNKMSTPAVRLVAAALRMPGTDEAIPQLLNITYEDDGPEISLEHSEIKIDIPSYSQMIRDPRIGSVICSATSLSMILGCYGIDITPEEAAWSVWDNVYGGAGNWSFNCAYAGSHGMEAYVAFMSSVDDLKREIVLGHPVEVSVAYKSDEAVAKNLPVLHNAPTEHTAGHLIVICGFTKENAQEYLIAHDPAARDNSGVEVKYLRSEFEKAWRKRAAYIIHPRAAKPSVSARIGASLEAAGDGIKNNKAGVECVLFTLKNGNETIDLSEKNARTIMYTPDGQNWSYIEPEKDSSNLRFDMTTPAGKYRFLIIVKNKRIFEAQLDWKGIA